MREEETTIRLRESDRLLRDSSVPRQSRGFGASEFGNLEARANKQHDWMRLVVATAHSLQMCRVTGNKVKKLETSSLLSFSGLWFFVGRNPRVDWPDAQM
jgi:ribosomal protein L19E